MLTIYGIPNCDTMKKAMQQLSSMGLVFAFHDYKKAGITKAKLEEWCRQAGWENLLNKKSTTWRELPAEVQQQATTKAAAIQLMQQHTTLIKRPVLEHKNGILVGFKAEAYAALAE